MKFRVLSWAISNASTISYIYRNMELYVKRAVGEKHFKSQKILDEIVGDLTESAIKLKFTGLSSNKEVTLTLRLTL